MTEIPQLPTQNDPGYHALENQKPFFKWMGLGVLSLGLAIIIIDTTLLNVSLSTIIKDLNTDLKSLQWVITAYALVLAALTITGGRLGDLYGRKKMFMLGAIIFATGSFLASVSHSMPILLLGESIIEGIGAALMMPATASLVVSNFSGKERALAFGVWGAVAGASSAVGPLLGGYLTSHFSWRWGFRINIFVAAVVIIGALLLIKDSRDEEHKPSLDWLGVALSSLGLFTLVFGIIESTTYGWWKAKEAFSLFGHSLALGGISIVPFALLLGLLLIAAFIFWENHTEKKGRTPLVSMSIFKVRQFSAGVATISILSLGMTGMIFALPVFLQSVKKLDAFHTGLALLPLSAAILITAPLVGFLSKKIEPRTFIQAGLLVDVVAAIILRQTINADVTVTKLIPGLALYGLGMGMVFAPISNLILSAVPVGQSGEASGVNNTLRQVGASLGAAIIGAAVLASLTGHLAKGINASAVIPENIKAQIVQKISSPDSNVEFGSASELPPGTPPQIKTEMDGLVKQASAESTRDAYVYSALFAFIGFLISLFLPKMHEAEEKEQALPKSRYALAFVLAAISITAAALILRQSSSKTITAGQKTSLTADEIRGVFSPPPPITYNNTSPSPATAPSPSPTSLPNQSPRGELASSSPSASPVWQTYKNERLGFEYSYPNTWQAQNPEANSVAFVNAQNQFVYIQAFSNPDSSLEQVNRQLSGSPSVSAISQTTFKGQPALAFITIDNLKAITFLYNSRLYYIFGVNFLDENKFVLL